MDFNYYHKAVYYAILKIHHRMYTQFYGVGLTAHYLRILAQSSSIESMLSLNLHKNHRFFYPDSSNDLNTPSCSSVKPKILNQNEHLQPLVIPFFIVYDTII